MGDTSTDRSGDFLTALLTTMEEEGDEQDETDKGEERAGEPDPLKPTAVREHKPEDNTGERRANLGDGRHQRHDTGRLANCEPLSREEHQRRGCRRETDTDEDRYHENSGDRFLRHDRDVADEGERRPTEHDASPPLRQVREQPTNGAATRSAIFVAEANVPARTVE